MATLNTDTSVVDYLKSTGKDSSFSARSASAKTYGINDYSGTAEQNVALLGALKKGSSPQPAPVPASPFSPVSAAPGTPATPANPAAVNDLTGANAYINANQKTDQASASAGSDVPVRTSSQTYGDIFANVQKTIASGAGTKPTAPGFEDTYKAEVSKAGINDLETSVNDLTKQEQDLRAGLRQQKFDEYGKPVAMNVIEGRVGEEERAATERLDAVLRQKDYATNQLKTKYDVVNNLMNFKKLDYQTASDQYNTAFSQNLQMFNTVKGISDDQKSEREHEQDNARANAQIVYNSIQSGGLKLDDISPDQKLVIQKMEIQAGLPTGFYSNLQSKNPKADIVTSTSREDNGKKYVDIIMRNSDGSLSTKSMYVGATDKASGGKPTEAETVKSSAKLVASQLASRAGADGYVAPEDYKTARRAWVNAGYDANDFDVRFAKTYANPDSRDVIGISTKALD